MVLRHLQAGVRVTFSLDSPGRWDLIHQCRNAQRQLNTVSDLEIGTQPVMKREEDRSSAEFDASGGLNS